MYVDLKEHLKVFFFRTAFNHFYSNKGKLFAFFTETFYINIMCESEMNDEIKQTLYCGNARVLKCGNFEQRNEIYMLEVQAELTDIQVSPKAGQFYMIQSAMSNVQFGRPISVYHAERKGNTQNVQFLILEKGEGTKELCHLIAGDNIKLIGPLGNSWPVENQADIAIVGGGIGVAPVANLASTLKDGTYDFYASFKSGSYALKNVHAKNLTITTDDGSVGIHGMLSAAFTADVIKEKGYKTIYACGPTPMLAYVQAEAKKAGVKCWLSLEKKMLCGVGACLGCTIKTKSGNKRVCKDGPIFDASILEFPETKRTRKNPVENPDLSVNICGVSFKNPVIAASGTFGFGQNYREFFDVNLLGGISSKGLTLEPKAGNEGERIIEVSSGDINSIGLENPGVPHFIEHELPEMLKLDTVSIANLAGHDLDSYVKGAELLDKTDVPMIELNISCPNVKAGGMAWGINPEQAKICVSAVRKATKKPLIVKLSPNAPDLVAVAKACEKAGADALSLINTIQAVAIDIETGKPYFNNIKAGLCGPAVKPIALRMVYDVCKEVSIPVIGLGGISKWQDAVEFIMAGACAIQVGSATFSNPNAMIEIIQGLENFMKTHGYKSIEEMRGIAQ